LRRCRHTCQFSCLRNRLATVTFFPSFVIRTLKNPQFAITSLRLDMIFTASFPPSNLIVEGVIFEITGKYDNWMLPIYFLRLLPPEAKAIRLPFGQKSQAH
jgi:hypothetical protein